MQGKHSEQFRKVFVFLWWIFVHCDKTFALQKKTCKKACKKMLPSGEMAAFQIQKKLT